MEQNLPEANRASTKHKNSSFYELEIAVLVFKTAHQQIPSYVRLTHSTFLCTIL